MTTISYGFPKPKLKIKFSKTGSCEASKQRWIKENCAPNVSLNGNKDSMRKESKKAASADDWTPAIDLQLSPKKALRAAILKKRFADTILKAQKRLLDHVDPKNLRQEKEKLERQQQEEKARIEDQIRAAKVASSLKAQEELRLRREREREAARIALQKMEKTVEIEDNMKVLEELEIILFKARQGDRFGNIMERIGLFLKNDYMDYEDEEDGLFLQDLEEGEIYD